MRSGGAVVDGILERHAAEIGGDMTAYRNHCHRVFNLCTAAVPSDPETIEKVAIAAAFHDLGIWTNRTFDYLQPSMALATRHLEATDRMEWAAEIREMIAQHHKISRYRGQAGALVEPFRRADWCDVSWGWVGSDPARRLRRGLLADFPDAGFHRLLLRLELDHIRRHPFNPLPVFRL